MGTHHHPTAPGVRMPTLPQLPAEPRVPPGVPPAPHSSAVTQGSAPGSAASHAAPTPGPPPAAPSAPHGPRLAATPKHAGPTPRCPSDAPGRRWPPWGGRRGGCAGRPPPENTVKGTKRDTGVTTGLGQVAPHGLACPRAHRGQVGDDPVPADRSQHVHGPWVAGGAGLG